MKFNNILNNFSSGEWSPKMRSRTDAQQYASACERLLNAYPLIQGGAFRRSGFKHMNLPSIDQNKLATGTKLIPYNFSNGAQFIICANTDTVSDWFVVQVGFNIAPVTFGVTAGVGATVTGTPKKMHITQVGDLLFIVDSEGTKTPFVFTLEGATFNIRTLAKYVGLGNDPTREWQSFPYRDLQAQGSSVNLSTGATSGATTMSSSAAFFFPGHVGARFNLSTGGVTGNVLITGYNSSNSVNISVTSNLGSTGPYGTAAGTSWQESAWSDYRGWPRAITAFQGRLIYGGSSSNYDTIWGTRISNVLDLMERPFEQDTDFAGFPQDNSRPFTLTPTSAEISNIKALSSSKTLVINTDKYEIVAYGSNGALGPLDVQFESSTSFGADAVQPVRVNNFVTFVQRSGKKIRDVVFNFNEDQYKSNDLSFIADHYFNTTNTILFDSKIQEMCSTKKDSILWVRPEITGELFGVTLDRDYSVNGWFEVQTQGKVYGITSGGNNYDDLFAVIERKNTVLGTKYYLEKLTALYEFPDQTLTGSAFSYLESYVDSDYIQGPTYVDSWAAQNIFINGDTPYTPQTLWTGFDHLAGFEVEVIADGQYIGSQIVTNTGEVTTPTAVQAILVGLKYETLIKTLPIELGQQVPGTPQAFIKRIDEITIKFWNTLGAKYGVSESDLIDIDFKDPNDTMDALAKFVTTFEKLKVEGTYYEETQVVIKQDKPWPCNVSAIISRGVLYD